MSTFGLSFASSSLIVNDESQLHGTTINGGQLSGSSNSNSSSNSSVSSINLKTNSSSSFSAMLPGTTSASVTTGLISSSVASANNHTNGTINNNTNNNNNNNSNNTNNNNNNSNNNNNNNNNNNASPPPTSSATILATSSSSSPTSFKTSSNYESTHSRLIAGYPRLPGLYGSTYATAAAAAAHHTTDQSSPFYQTNSASFYPSLSSHYDLDKSNGNSWTPLASQTPYSPYDPHHSFYGPYGNCYGAIDSAARRKNATRETTNTLKAWLYEHRKNPYPTKGEKIMLAIITKMTLTQVSTWFANARRRLKKENKMTWEPKNKSTECRDNDSDKDSTKDIDEDINGSIKNDNGNGLRIKEQERSNGGQSAPIASTHGNMVKGHHLLLSNHHGQLANNTPVHSQTLAGLSVEGDNTMDGQRPKIWSLAQTATSAEASASLAGRIYPADWSAAAYAAQFQPGNMSDNLSLINPLSEHYHHHHHHHHAHHHYSGSQATSSSSSSSSGPAVLINGQHQHVQSPASLSSTHQNPASHHNHHFYSSAKPNGTSSWYNNVDEQPNGSPHVLSNHHSHHNHFVNSRNNVGMAGANGTQFGCSPAVSTFLPGNIPMSI